MIYSDWDIKRAVYQGELEIEPFDNSMVQPASIDVRLDSYFRVFTNTDYTHIDPAEEQDGLTKLVQPPENGAFILHPGAFVLATTYERFRLGDHMAGRLEGKSSLGRLGLVTHSTAGFIDPGFNGQITLELSNVSTLPMKLWPGMKIGQLCLIRLSHRAEKPYGSKSTGSHYQNQVGPMPSQAWRNFTSWTHSPDQP